MIIWVLCVCGCGALFTGIGIYACRRTDPMWFWSGSTVSREEITDIPAYNRANSRMWIAYSVLFWLSGVLGGRYPMFGAITLGIACTAGLLWLVAAYKKIYRTYARPQK